MYFGNTNSVITVHNCGIGPDCFCGPDKDSGKGLCINGNQGCGPSCTTSADCGAGRSCFTGLCGLSATCLYSYQAQCRNPGLKKRLFGRKVAGGFSGLEEGSGDIYYPPGTVFLNGKIVGVDA